MTRSADGVSEGCLRAKHRPQDRHRDAGGFSHDQLAEQRTGPGPYLVGLLPPPPEATL